MNILTIPTDILLFLFLPTNGLNVSHFGLKHLLKALNVNEKHDARPTWRRRRRGGEGGEEEEEEEEKEEEEGTQPAAAH